MSRLVLAPMVLALCAACGGGNTTPSTSAAFLSGQEEVHFERAMQARSAGDAPRAEAELLESLAANPRYLAAHMALGDLRLDMSRYADAASSFREAIALREATVDGHLGLARALMGMGDAESALGHATRAAELTDGRTLQELQSATYVTLGDVHLALGQSAEATDAFELALQTWAGNTQARIHLARLRADAGETQAAMTLLARAETFEEDPEQLLELGSIFMDLRAYDRAVDALTKAHELAPSADRVLHLLADAHMRSGARDIGIQLATELIQRNPQYLDAYPVRGRGELARGASGVAVARADADRVLSVQPDHFDALLLLGDVEVTEARQANSAGDVASASLHVAAAQRAYGRAREQRPDDVDAIDHVVRLYHMQGDWPEVIALLSPAVDRLDAMSDWRQLLVDALLGSGDVERALPVFSALANDRTSDHAMHFEVARLALEHPGTLAPDVVLAHARDAVERSGGGTQQYQLLLIDALMAAERYGEADSRIGLAEDAWPNSPDVEARRELYNALR